MVQRYIEIFFLKASLFLRYDIVYSSHGDHLTYYMLTRASGMTAGRIFAGLALLTAFRLSCTYINHLLRCNKRRTSESLDCTHRSLIVVESPAEQLVSSFPEFSSLPFCHC